PGDLQGQGRGSRGWGWGARRGARGGGRWRAGRGGGCHARGGERGGERRGARKGRARWVRRGLRGRRGGRPRRGSAYPPRRPPAAATGAPLAGMIPAPATVALQIATPVASAAPQLIVRIPVAVPARGMARVGVTPSGRPRILPATTKPPAVTVSCTQLAIGVG